jgi:hypothetical protein
MNVMTDEAIIAYLLEELPEEALERFEDECFAQESWPAQISLVEEDLIDDYLRNKLSAERRRRFEQKYLTTDARLERVSMAAALLRHIDESNGKAKAVAPVPPGNLSWAERLRAFWQGQTWGLRAAAGVALIAILIGAFWFIPIRTPSPRTFATLNLTLSSNNRAEGAQIGRIKLPPDTDDLKIFLQLPGQLPEAAGYQVELENDNRQAKPAKITGKDGQSVEVVVAAAELAPGQYVLKLFTVQPDGSKQRINGSYFFVIE